MPGGTVSVWKTRNGRGDWRVLHTHPFALLRALTQDELDTAIDGYVGFVKLLIGSIACSECHNHLMGVGGDDEDKTAWPKLLQLLVKLAELAKEGGRTKEDFAPHAAIQLLLLWSVTLHNHVNGKLGKDLWPPLEKLGLDLDPDSSHSTMRRLGGSPCAPDLVRGGDNSQGPPVSDYPQCVLCAIMERAWMKYAPPGLKVCNGNAVEEWGAVIRTRDSVPPAHYIT